jgi:4-methyl-5(b-hydroxyethyl)-thiazole monophosphate biosynthesis
MKTAIVFIADGFEECEGLLVVDLLRRAEVNVTTASIMGRTEIKSSHGITLKADVLAEDVDYSSADMIVLPGGLPGTSYLGENQIVREQCIAFAKDKYVAAICAAPSVLASLGLLEGKPATCHPAFEGKMAGAIVTKESVSVAGNIITGQGLGAGIPFALKLVETLVDKVTADKIAAAISYKG